LPVLQPQAMPEKQTCRDRGSVYQASGSPALASPLSMKSLQMVGTTFS
jgi:hypothetical protein